MFTESALLSDLEQLMSGIAYRLIVIAGLRQLRNTRFDNAPTFESPLVGYHSLALLARFVPWVRMRKANHSVRVKEDEYQWIVGEQWCNGQCNGDMSTLALAWWGSVGNTLRTAAWWGNWRGVSFSAMMRSWISSMLNRFRIPRAARYLPAATLVSHYSHKLTYNPQSS